MTRSIRPRVRLLSAAMLCCLLGPVGCGSGSNQVVEQPDAELLQAKKQEFAEFQKKMAQQSKLPGQR